MLSMKRILPFFVLFALFSSTVFASDPVVWSVNSRSDVLKGDAKGVSVSDDGTIRVSGKISEVFNTEQSFVWSSTRDSAGNVYLGTGGEGKLFKVDAAGKGSLFSDFNEVNVSAVAVAANGELFAATSPDGKVYRLDASGKASVYFEPKEKYIWALTVFPDGSLAVATGENGKIFKVKSAGAAPEASLLFDTSETHIISLAADAAGNLYAGSDSNGIVYRFGSDNKPFALLDSPLREIHQLAIGSDGSVYALALGDSISAPKTDAAAAPATPESKTVSVEKPNPAAPEQPSKSRYDLSGAKSAVYRLDKDGATSIVWNSSTVAAFSIANVAQKILIGTSDKGRVYSVKSDGTLETLELQTDEGQVSGIMSAPGTAGLMLVTSSQGKLFKVGANGSEGTYTSAVLDAKYSSAWGRIWWRGIGNVSVQTRSGNTETPDETWSAWSAPTNDSLNSPVKSPRSKYFQWKAVLKSEASGEATLSEVNVSFKQSNIAPEILSLQVLPTNVGLAPNPSVPIDPNIELSGQDPAIYGIPNAPIPPRKLYQRGARALQWTAEDRNGDKMVYEVRYKLVGEERFRVLKSDLVETFLTVDGLALSDGRYVFEIVAKDSPSNPKGEELSGSRQTEPIDIDNTAPTVASGAVQVSAGGASVTFNALDLASYINRAEYSVDGGEWKPVYADDGISDGPKESFTIKFPLTDAAEQSVVIRVFDSNGNIGTARAVIKIAPSPAKTK